MTKINDGGPAFPIGSGDMRDPCGMTLRDYFAAKATQGVLSEGGAGGFSLLATISYETADAMLVERAKGGER